MADKELTDKIDALTKERDELTRENIDLRANMETMKTEFTNEIAAMSKELSSSKKISDQVAPSFTVDGDTYRIIGRTFRYKGKLYTIQELQKDEAVQRALINIKAGFLVKVTDVEPAITA